MNLFHKLYNNLFPKYLYHDKYGKIYLPDYNLNVEFSNNVPKVYNSEGRQMEFFFVKDTHSAHSPFLNSKYIIWDRFNFGLDTHFYSHKNMLHQMGKPIYKYGYLAESESLVPDDYKLFEKHKGLENDFDLIFTQSDKILNSIENSRFAPISAGLWFGNSINGGILDKNSYKEKTKNISIVSSNKLNSSLHKFRYDLAFKCKNERLADTYGTFDGGPLIKLADSLTDYRYSIVIENDISDYWFTERITSCFAAMTIPIYCGARKIGNFFNTDGIVFIGPEDYDDINKILLQCTEKEYFARLPAIMENFEKSKRYISAFDYIYEEYLINRKK